MIAYDKYGKVTITKVARTTKAHGQSYLVGQYEARGGNSIGYGKTPKEALRDWRLAEKELAKLSIDHAE